MHKVKGQQLWTCAREAVFVKRGKTFFLILAAAVCVAAAMWLYQSWRDEQDITGNMELANVYVVKEKGDRLTIYSQEGKLEFAVKSDLEETAYKGLADIKIERQQVKKLVCKPEIISGKVLAIGETFLDLENYGQIPLAENPGCFSVGTEIASSSRDLVFVGQMDAQFAVAEGKICGIFLPEEKVAASETMPGEVSISTETASPNGGDPSKGFAGELGTNGMIRVIIKTDGYAAYEHAEVKLRGTKKIYVKRGKQETEVQPGEEVSFTPDSMKEKRVSIRSEEGGRIEVNSINRSCGKPLYRGTLEVVKAESGLNLINELLLEEYLYGVIPSEMPAEYAKEALKAQAVCARSYAAKHIKNNRLKQLGAHVDDSVSYQVYNNTREDERCNQAVDETKGMLAYQNGTIASTYFFSTSCGVTASVQDVGFSSEKIPYLCGKLQEPPTDQNAAERAKLVSDTYGNEDLFRKFLDEDRNVLEKAQPWYRWRTTISIGDMENNINEKIGSRCQASADNIQVLQADGTYVSEQIGSIGKLKRVRIKKRGSGGVVRTALIVGTEKTVKVRTEYNIRLLLFNENAIVTKNDGTNVSGMNMLPSGFFVLDKTGSAYVVRGGGFGHGTGMSQTGANELAQAGKNHEEIMKYYFEGVEIRPLL